MTTKTRRVAQVVSTARRQSKEVVRAPVVILEHIYFLYAWSQKAQTFVSKQTFLLCMCFFPGVARGDHIRAITMDDVRATDLVFSITCPYVVMPRQNPATSFWVEFTAVVAVLGSFMEKVRSVCFFWRQDTRTVAESDLQNAESFGFCLLLGSITVWKVTPCWSKCCWWHHLKIERFHCYTYAPRTNVCTMICSGNTMLFKSA